MDKSSLLELRKIMRRDEPPVDWVYSIYVTPENEVCWESMRKFSSFDLDETFRHKDIMKKALSGAFAKELFSVPLHDQPKNLISIRNMESGDESSIETFVNDVLSSYTHTDPYYAMLAHLTYDVPAKTSDGMKLEDGDTVYQAILFAICPASLSKPALGYNESAGVSELDRRWTIGSPIEGFLYPAFNERSGDLNEVLYRAKKDINSQLFNTLFSADLPVTADMQKQAFQTLMDRLDVSVKSAASLQEDLAHLEAEDVNLLEQTEAKKLAERCGIKTDHFDEAFEETVGDTPLTISALREPAVIVKTDSAAIKIDTDKTELIATREIDGITYILIPADGSVLVNGIPSIALTSENAGDTKVTDGSKIPGDSEDAHGSENAGDSGDARGSENAADSGDARGSENAGDSEDADQSENAGDSGDARGSENAGDSGDARGSENAGDSNDTGEPYPLSDDIFNDHSSKSSDEDN